MNTRLTHRRKWLIGSLALLATLPALAHDFRAGAIVIDHPYATPTLAGVSNGAVYFRSLTNKGKTDDRLISATTPVAQSVELHRMSLDGDIMRMRATQAIELPAGQEVRMRHGSGQAASQHLMLVNLKQPLVVGERFDITLKFEKSGETTVKVWVQQPRGGAVDHSKH